MDVGPVPIGREDALYAGGGCKNRVSAGSWPVGTGPTSSRAIDYTDRGVCAFSADSESRELSIVTKPDDKSEYSSAEYSRPIDADSPQAFSSHPEAESHQTTPRDEREQIRGDYALSKRRTIVIDHSRRMVRIGGKPIRLTLVEYSILGLLAGRPYWPFSRAEIVQAVAAADLPLTEESLPDEIGSLRDKLGAFSDYVQSVPGFGYRFKE